MTQPRTPTEPSMPMTRPALSRQRVRLGLAVAIVLPALLTALLVWGDGSVSLALDALLLLIGVILASLIGGLWPALLSALVSSTLLNYYFIPPVRTLRVSEPHNVGTIVGFVLVALLVSTVVNRAAVAAAAANRAASESRTLAAAAEATLRGDEGLPALLEQLRTAFGMTSASLLERGPRAGVAGQRGPAPNVPTAPSARSADVWHIVHSRGPEPPTLPAEADVQVTAGADLVLALSGRSLTSGDRRVLDAFAAQAQGLLERDRLARSAAIAARLEATEHLRDALLAAVGHDLRMPLASARAAVSSLGSTDVTWSSEERDELLATANESLERLSTLIADLLDLSRLRAGVLTVTPDTVWLDELVPPALDELGPAAARVVLLLPDDLPPAVGDAALVTRALVNIIGNALRHAPDSDLPLVTASATTDQVLVRVIDHGPGIPQPDHDRVFQPFQRLGDTDNTTGLGLGLALSRGLVEAMDGTLEPEETPGGGLTMVLALPIAAPAAHSIADIPAAPVAPGETS